MTDATCGDEQRVRKLDVWTIDLTGVRERLREWNVSVPEFAALAGLYVPDAYTLLRTKNPRVGAVKCARIMRALETLEREHASVPEGALDALDGGSDVDRTG